MGLDICTKNNNLSRKQPFIKEEGSKKFLKLPQGKEGINPTFEF
jgi:hypothetical protein